MKEKMKKIKLIVPMIMILFITGCNDDFLDLKPLDAVSEASVWEDLNLIDLNFNQSYIHMS